MWSHLERIIGIHFLFCKWSRFLLPILFSPVLFITIKDPTDLQKIWSLPIFPWNNVVQLVFVQTSSVRKIKLELSVSFVVWRSYVRRNLFYIAVTPDPLDENGPVPSQTRIQTVLLLKHPIVICHTPDVSTVVGRRFLCTPFSTSKLSFTSLYVLWFPFSPDLSSSRFRGLCFLSTRNQSDKKFYTY